MTFSHFQYALSLVVGLAFLAGAIAHLIGPRPLVEGYRRWGYPGGFRFVTAAIHCATAMLVFFGHAQLGALLGLATTIVAFATLAYNKELASAGPSVVLMALLIVMLA